MDRKYCIDSSSLIDIWNENGSYPKDVFTKLWEKVSEYIKEGCIVSSIEVYEELKNQKNADLGLWLSKNTDNFLQVNSNQIKILKELLVKYPLFAVGQENKADPILVSLAITENLTIITSENLQKTPSPYIPKIPNLARDFDAKCINLIEFCRREGFKWS